MAAERFPSVGITTKVFGGEVEGPGFSPERRMVFPREGPSLTGYLAPKGGGCPYEQMIENVRKGEGTRWPRRKESKRAGA
jgi:hypothetical protein